MLFGFLSNNKTKIFVDNEYKQLAHEKNKYIFSFLNYTSTKKLNNYFNIKLYGKSELALIIYDFNKSKYYYHPTIYDFNYNNPDEIISEFNIILNFYSFFGCIKTETIYSTINTFLFKISENIFYK